MNLHDNIVRQKILKELKSQLAALQRRSEATKISDPYRKAKFKTLDNTNADKLEMYKNLNEIKNRYYKVLVDTQTDVDNIISQIGNFGDDPVIRNYESKLLAMQATLRGKKEEGIALSRSGVKSDAEKQRKIELYQEEVHKNARSNKKVNGEKNKERQKVDELFSEVWLKYFIAALFVGLAVGGTHFLVDYYNTKHTQDIVSEEQTSSDIEVEDDNAEVDSPDAGGGADDLDGEIDTGVDTGDSDSVSISEFITTEVVVDTLKWTLVAAGIALAAMLILAGISYYAGKYKKKKSNEKQVEKGRVHEKLHEKVNSRKVDSMMDKVSKLMDINDRATAIEKALIERAEAQRKAKASPPKPAAVTSPSSIPAPTVAASSSPAPIPAQVVQGKDGRVDELMEELARERRERRRDMGDLLDEIKRNRGGVAAPISALPSGGVSPGDLDALRAEIRALRSQPQPAPVSVPTPTPLPPVRERVVERDAGQQTDSVPNNLGVESTIDALNRAIMVNRVRGGHNPVAGNMKIEHGGLEGDHRHHFKVSADRITNAETRVFDFLRETMGQKFDYTRNGHEIIFSVSSDVTDAELSSRLKAFDSDVQRSRYARRGLGAPVVGSHGLSM